MEERFDFAIASKEGGHIHNKIPDHRKIGKGLDEDGSAQKIFPMCPTRQDHLSAYPYGAGPANGSAAGISESETSVLFILNTEQCLQQIHLFPRFELEGLNPWRGLPLGIESPNLQCKEVRIHSRLFDCRDVQLAIFELVDLFIDYWLLIIDH